ncbi:phage tail spike protein [Bacillus sp. 166amftsu]|uniref:phage tail spike protein n=1 Tax=Bacillus sp. 166amftsu TaxID=1761753 RepID=UPI00089B6EF6|nr:phage tail spike protein [Bacillus sp. 166amftsu]SDY42750.1 phage minor structural protein, N-terminal region [Bacillus sp. 166amftsu]
MIILYKPNETDFTHNGIGVLDANIYEAEVEEILNGLYSLTFSYPLFAPHGLEIQGMCIVKAPTPDGDQLFRVSTPTVSMGEIKVQCYHIFYDLTENLIEDIYINLQSGIVAMSKISSGCQYAHQFNFSSDIRSVASARLVRKNPVEAILDTSQDNSFLNRWGGELKRDNFDVKMLVNRGIDRGVVIQHKKDLLGYEGNVDWKSPVTRIMPQGFDGLFLPEKYVDSPLINKYPHPKIRVVEFKHIKAAIGDNAKDPDAVPLEEAYKLLRQAAKEMFDVQHVDQPKGTYKVEFQELSQTEEYKDYAILQHVWMGDIVTVKHIEDGINVQAKVIAYKYDPIKKEYKNITIGNYKASFTDIAGKVDQIQNDISDMPTSILEAAKEHATSLINSGFGGHVRNYPDRILIMDTEDEMTAKKVWQWNINGLGYSSTGINGPYGTAITMDGRIVADFITAGTLNANLLNGQLIKGVTIQTSNSKTFVSIDDQFIRLYEGGLVRAFFGYHKTLAGNIEAKYIFGGDNTAEGVLGSLYVSHSHFSNNDSFGRFGIVDSVKYQPNDPTPYVVYSSYLEMYRKKRICTLHGDEYAVLQSKTGKIRFMKGDESAASMSLGVTGYDNYTDLELPTVILRNSLLANQSGIFQVLDKGVGFGSVQAHIISPSLREYKSNIRDVPFSALEKIRNAKVREFNYKSDVNELYEMRENKAPNDPPLTKRDIKQYYGFVVDECDDVFVDKAGTGTHLYSTALLTVKAVQELEEKHDAEIEKLQERNAEQERVIHELQQKNNDLEERVLVLERMVTQ